MSSLRDLFRSGPPAPRVAVLADALFFARAVPLEAGLSAADAEAQVGLALEALSPFPLNQLYHGTHRPPGAPRAIAYAAYRRRFTVDQTDAWSGCELVLPAFAAMLGADVGAHATLVLSAPDGLTALRFDGEGLPESVLFRPLAPETTPEARAAARAELVRTAGGTGRTVDAEGTPEAQPSTGDERFIFRCGSVVSTLPAAVAASMDVRDKGELARLARARRRDVLLWRCTLGALAACLVMGLAELALLGGGAWQAARRAKVAAQKPTVARIMDEQDLASRIGDLSTQRLLPLEMISAVAPERVAPGAPPAIQFIRASTSALNTLEVEAQTDNAGAIPGYRTALEQTGLCDKVEIRDPRTHGNTVTFTLVVTFKKGAVTPDS
jgi:hypothetical protein